MNASSAEMADYSVYRSVELGKKIGETLSLLERVRALGRPIVLVMLGMAMLARFILIADATWLRMMGAGYGALAGLIVGALTGVVWLVHAELRRLEELLLLILDVSARVARARAGEDNDSRPTPAELLPPVYKQVFAPLITEVLRKQSRLFGRPLGWVVDGILSRAVKLLAGVLERRKVGWEWFERGSKATAAAELPPAPEAPALPAAEASADALEPAPAPTEGDGPQEPAEQSVEDDGVEPSDKAETRVIVEEVGQRIRAKFVPLWVGLGLLAALALSPVALVAYWAG